MGITDDDRKAIIEYRIEKSFQNFKEAEDVFALGHYSLCANRLYYSTFHMACALLIKDGLSTHTHAGMLRLINQHFVKTSILDRQDARLISNLFSMRQQGDYGDTFDYEKDEILSLIPMTQSLLNKIKNLIKNA